jgi:type VI secretion system secreted protein VgrG
VVPAAEPFRVASITPRVRMPGPQTAVVVGKSGEEIWTDEYGRVKVQFMWDRDGKSDENSSCWVRVAQIWAGNTFGGFQIPRIGEEVIVDFLGGDPDYPIIVGRVYNKDNAVPYPLPGEQTKSGIKTRSTKKGTAENFNELRFEDKKGDEEIYFHAEKNFNRVVENDDSLKVGFEKKDKGDQKIEVYNDQTLTIGAGSKGGSQTIVVYKDRTAEMKTGNDTITITQGNHKTEITAGKSETSAMQSIELKVGGNSIKIDQSGITLKGIKISVEGSATAEVKSPMTKVNGDGMVMIQGGLVKIN